MKNYFQALVMLLLFSISVRGQQNPAASDTNPNQYLNLFLDGIPEQQDYIRQQINFVNFMRERQLADVHLLITSQQTASDGTEYTLMFFGQKMFFGRNDTLKYISNMHNTLDEIRDRLVSKIGMGLMAYVSRLPENGNFAITFQPASTSGILREGEAGNWKNWVFTITTNGYLNGEKSYRNLYVYGGLSAGKVTDDWKINLRMNGAYNYTKYDYDDLVYISETQSKAADALIVRSISGHWSVGLAGSMYASTYNNYDFNGTLSPAIEWDFFPYSASTSRLFTVLYQITPGYYNYTDTTLYNKLDEFLLSQSVTSSVSMIEKWGTVSVSLYGTHYFHDWSKNALSVSSSLSLRIIKGLDLNLNGVIGLVHNQLNLPKQNATPEEVLTRQKELATNYNYYASIGLSYSFGAIYNNVVNARMNLLE